MTTGESGISLCDTCSNCECIFQAGIVRKQCEFYIEEVEEIDFVAEHPKADMSKVNKIMVNGKEYVSIDRVLEIIDRLDAEAVEDFELDTDYGLAVVHERFAMARKKIKALKGGHR